MVTLKQSVKAHQGGVVRIKAVERLQSCREEDFDGLPSWAHYDTLLTLGTDWNTRVWSVQPTMNDDEVTLQAVAQVTFFITIMKFSLYDDLVGSEKEKVSVP